MNENPLGEAVGFLTSFLELYEGGSTDSETWLADKLWVMDAATESGFEPQPPPEDSEMAELIRIADQFVGVGGDVQRWSLLYQTLFQSIGFRYVE